MQLLSHALRKAVWSKKLASIWYVGVVLRVLEEHEWCKPTNWFIKNSILFVGLWNHGHKMLIHRDKHILLEKMNHTLKEYGYTIVVKDIRFSSRHSEAKPKNLINE